MIFRTFFRLQRRNREERRGREGGRGGTGGRAEGRIPQVSMPPDRLIPPPLSLSPSLMKIAQRQSLRSIIMRNSKVRIHIPDIPRQSESNVSSSMDYCQISQPHSHSDSWSQMPHSWWRRRCRVPGVCPAGVGRRWEGGRGPKYWSIKLLISHELNSLNLVRLLWCTNGPRSMI